MSFKYQAPSDYKSKSIVISGQCYSVKNGVVESKVDIYHILAPMHFIRIVDVKTDPKKETAITKA